MQLCDKSKTGIVFGNYHYTTVTKSIEISKTDFNQLIFKYFNKNIKYYESL